MIVVPTPTLAPAECLVTFKADAKDGPYIDLTRDFVPRNSGRMYISKRAVEDMAKELGFPTPKAFEEVKELAESALDENEQLKSDLREAERQLEAVDVLNLRKTRKKEKV